MATNLLILGDLVNKCHVFPLNMRIAYQHNLDLLMVIISNTLI